MSAIKRALVLLLAVGISWRLGASPAQALTNLNYALFQDGFSEGASVTGSFSGADLDGNGILVHFPTDGAPFPIEHLELSAFSMHFSGNSLSPAFDLTLDDLYGFVYEIGTSGVGDDPAFDPTVNRDLIEGIGLIGANHFYSSGLGPNGVVGGYVGGQIDFGDFGDLADMALDSSDHLALATPVPEAAGFGLLIAAGLAVDVIWRTRRQPSLWRRHEPEARGYSPAAGWFGSTMASYTSGLTSA